ncbi:hypothetical protein EMIT0373P_10499 [Pseudomonas chlororaphis]
MRFLFVRSLVTAESPLGVIGKSGIGSTPVGPTLETARSSEVVVHSVVPPSKISRT